MSKGFSKSFAAILREDETLSRLSAERNDLLEMTRQNNAAMHERLCEIARREFGVEVGSIVTDGKSKFQVAEIVPFYPNYVPTHKPWIKGYRVKKDGSLSTIAQSLFEKWGVYDQYLADMAMEDQRRKEAEK